MKTAIQMITEQAKRRDTIGRNKVQVITGDPDTVGNLYACQLFNSSDSVEKLTHVIIRTERHEFLIKFRMMEITSLLQHNNVKTVVEILESREEGANNQQGEESQKGESEE